MSNTDHGAGTSGHAEPGTTDQVTDQVTDQATDRATDPATDRDAPVIQSATGPALPPPLAVFGGTAVIAALLLLVRRLRLRRQPTSAERLSEATRSLGAASAGLAGRAAGRVSSAAAPVAERTGELALQGARVGAEGATRVATTLAEVPHVVAEGGAKVHRVWRKWTGRLILSLAGGTGYVLGARAGREQYDQIVRLANDVAHRPQLKQARDKVQTAVRDQTSGGPTA